MDKLMGNGIDSLLPVERMGKPDGGFSDGETQSCGGVCLLLRVSSPVCHHFYSDILDVGSCFLEKLQQGIALQVADIERSDRSHGRIDRKGSIPVTHSL
jgi:hypothetical protein